LRVSTLTRDIDIANLSDVCPSVRPSVRYVPVSDENGSTYRHSFFTVQYSPIILVLPASNIIVRIDCFLRYRISAATRNFMSGKSDVYVLADAAKRGFNMVLFTEPVSRRNTFVGVTCAPPSALLVLKIVYRRGLSCELT